MIDIGTSGLRTIVIRPDGSLDGEHRRRMPPDIPVPGFVEFDAETLAETALALARATLEDAGPVVSVAVTAQRATTIVWDRRTGQPVGPAIGWQDLRTAGTCLAMAAQGFRFMPNQSATKLAYLLDTHDPNRQRADDLMFGTVETWIAWHLTGGPSGGLHVTDPTNAGMTGLIDVEPIAGVAWDDEILGALRIPETVLPAIVDSSEILGPCTALPGAPPLAALVGDQQASLIGQGCVRPGVAKLTFGTGAMLDTVSAATPQHSTRNDHGTFPIVAWRRNGQAVFGLEALMLTAGSCIEWLRDDMQLIGTPEESESVAAQCDDSGDVVFVPALMGLGTPQWDFGARGTLLGLSAGLGRAQVVRAVLEGIAQRGADLVDAAEADGAPHIEVLRVDGGMTVNSVFVQAIADAVQRPVEVSPVVEATSMGAGYLAGLASGTWSSTDDIAALWKPSATVEPQPGTARLRDRWHEAVPRSLRWIPDLSALQF